MTDRILIVDDEREIADLVALYLSNEGYQVQTSYNAADALAHVAAGGVDLALLDVMLPDLDGFTICRRYGSSTPGPSSCSPPRRTRSTR